MNLFEPGPDPLLPVDPDGAGDPLTALAVLDPAELRVRPLTEVAGRAARLRTARRSRFAVLGVAASVALVGAVTVLLPSGGTTAQPATGQTAVPAPTATVSVSPSQGAGVPAGCQDGATLDVASHPELAHLVSGTAPAPLAVVEVVALGGPECGFDDVPTAAVAARFAPGGRVDAGLVVSGPAEQPLLPARDGSDAESGLVSEQGTVHGAPATLEHWSPSTPVIAVDGTARVQWQEPATGSWWLVESSGLPTEDLLAAAEALGTSGERLDAATVPGTAEGWSALPARARRTAGHRFEVLYQAADGSGPTVNLSVSDVQEIGPQVVGQVSADALRTADVHGARAILRPIGTEGDSPSLIWAADGLYFTLYASPDQSFADLVALARAVEPVGPDDPRFGGGVVAAPTTPAAGAAPSAATPVPPTATDPGTVTVTAPATASAGPRTVTPVPATTTP
ncbi:hypothetical protein [Kineosporia sp. A_224]|uniref:hypothetical protein n=1 Tax=Kineosporia sp. A_224 TaxID=1962180 RepID=UPI000B4A8510|nr:hypothetical protein [Kineosporia sp. A_224]